MIFPKIKKIIAVLVMFSVFATTLPAVYATDAYSRFTDFPNGWSKAAMEHSVDNGLLSGRTASTINPKDYLTRAEMATIINRTFGAAIKANISKYTDVNPSHWYYDEIAKAVNMRTFVGDSGTTMNPNQNITREAVFTVIARALVLDTQDFSSLNKYSDGDKVSDWAKSAAAILTAKGYVNGNNAGMLSPKACITREEFAQIMYNIFKTYYTAAGEYKTTGKDSSLIRTTGVVLSNVTIDGDLVLGDGVGDGTVRLENVIIKGRLLCRGGEKAVKLVNTKVNEGVVVYDVNGTVHFDNYRTDIMFKDIKLLTPATFLEKSSTGSSGGGGGADRPDDPDEPDDPTEKEYYNVFFHNGSVPQAFDKVQIDKSEKKENRNLAFLEKSLDVIYEDYTDSTLPAYTRESFGYNNLDAEYEHQVEKEYIYESAPGVWSVFTDNTTVSKDIDVYYAAKRASVDAVVPVVDIPYSLEIRYDSNSRFTDSIIDAMISTGSTLEKDEVKSVINGKLAGIYNTINKETGMIDSAGNIYDKDYGLKIIDVIDYDQIQAKIKEYIEEMLNGSAEELEAVISLFDIPTLVDEIGGKELIALVDVSSIREMIKEDEFKGTAINFVKDKIKNDPAVIEKILNSSIKNTLIDKVAANNTFIAKLMDYNVFKAEVLNILKTSAVKTALINHLDKENVKAEFLNIIKADADFKSSVTGADDAALRKILVSAVADPGKVYKDNDPTYETMSVSAKKIRDAVVELISSKSQYEELKDAIEYVDYVYEALIYRYVTAKSDKFTGVSVTDENLEMLDDIIIEFLSKYFSADSSNQMSAELQSIFDKAIVDFSKNYVNGNPIIDGDADKDAKIKGFIEKTFIKFIKDYFAGTSSLVDDPDIISLANSIKAQFVDKVKVAQVSDIQQPIIDFVTDEANATFADSFVAENYNAIVDAMDDNFIKAFIDTLTEDEAKELVKEHATTEMIVSHISSMDEDSRIALAKEILGILDSYKPYQDFMKSFENKEQTFEINKDNTHFVSAVGHAIYNFSFEEIVEILNTKGFGPVINFLNSLEDGYVETIFNTSVKDYWIALEPVVKEVEESDDEDIKRYYTTKINITINVPLILHSIYDNYSDKFIKKIEDNDIYDYNKNLNLKKFVNIDWFNVVIGYDISRIDETTGATGYYIRDYMDYYGSMLDALIIFDDALCFYNTKDYDDEELVLVKKGLTKDFLAFLTELESLSDRIENGQPIKGSYTLQDLIDKVDSLNDVTASLGGTAAGGAATAIETVVDNIKNILENLGEGNLPGGYTLEDLTLLAEKLKTAINGMNGGRYEEVNATFEELISSSIKRLAAVIDELDKDGTISGKPLDSIFAKISVLNTIYKKYASQIKDIVSAIADAELGSLDISVDSEKLEDIIFGREEGDVFNIDSVIDGIKGKLGESEKSGYDEIDMVHIIDQYSKSLGGNNVTIQRRFY